MPPRSWRFRVDDILKAIDAVEVYTEGLDGDGFEAERMVVDAVLRNLSVIGEAAVNIPEEIRQLAPGVPWPDVIGMRNIVVHEYFGVSLPVVWHTIRVELPQLRESLLDLIARGPAETNDC